MADWCEGRDMDTSLGHATNLLQSRSQGHTAQPWPISWSNTSIHRRMYKHSNGNILQ